MRVPNLRVCTHVATEVARAGEKGEFTSCRTIWTTWPNTSSETHEKEGRSGGLETCKWPPRGTGTTVLTFPCPEHLHFFSNCGRCAVKYKFIKTTFIKKNFHQKPIFLRDHSEQKQHSPCLCESVAGRRPATPSHKHGLCPPLGVSTGLSVEHEGQQCSVERPAEGPKLGV